MQSFFCPQNTVGYLKPVWQHTTQMQCFFWGGWLCFREQCSTLLLQWGVESISSIARRLPFFNSVDFGLVVSLYMSTCWRKRFTELTTQHDEYFSPVSSSEQSIFYRRLSSLGSWMGWSRFQQGHPGRVYQIKWGKISTIENELFMSKLKTRGHYSFSADLDEHKFNNSRALKYLLGIIWTS